MPDYLSCGSCPQDFELSDITQFIEHKKWSCSTSQDAAQFAMNLLECVKCLRKFNTPWPLLIHIQLDHQQNVVRNLVLPRQQQLQHHAQQQQQQTNGNYDESEHKSVTTQTRTTSLQRSRCYPACCQKSEPVTMDDDACMQCPCVETTPPSCCQPSSETTKTTATVSCCQQQRKPPTKKVLPESCCPCPPKAETTTQDCQTDFEYFDFDMDLLLNDDQLGMTPTPDVPSSDNQAQEQMRSYSELPTVTETQTGEVQQHAQQGSPENSLWQVESMPMLPLLNASGPTTSAQTFFSQSSAEPVFHSSSTYLTRMPNIDVSAESRGRHELFANSDSQGQVRLASRKALREFRFSCHQCNKPFRQNVHLRKHVMAQHTNQKPHKCPHCGYTTVEKSHLTVHIRTHTGEKPFRCRNCTYSSAQNCTLKSHYLRRHPGSSVLCEICGDNYITEQEKNNHQKTCREMSTSTTGMDLGT